MPKRSSQKAQSHIAKVFDIVDRVGWAVQWVGGEANRDLPPYAYSVGLTGMNMPELILVGPYEPRVGFMVINETVTAFKEQRFGSDVSLAPGTWNRITTLPLKIEAVNDPKKFFDYALFALTWIKANNLIALPPLQIILPDAAGRFPGDASFDYYEPPRL